MSVPDHQIAVQVAVHHAKAFIRDHNDRHLDVLDDLNQRVTSPALFLTDTIRRLGRHNALQVFADPKLIENCIRLASQRGRSA